MDTHLKEQLAQLPHKPGIYQYYDSQGDLLYIGKAKDLFKRVNSYWSSRSQSPWTQLLVSQIHTIKIIEVTSEIEALILENSLVKSLKPKYNIQLKDDKTFPFLRVSLEPFPRFTITRKINQDNARYFGPFLSATYLRSMLTLLQQLFGIKTTSDTSYESRSNIPQQIGIGARNLDNPQVYNQNVEAAIRFLSAPQPHMEKVIKKAMDAAVTKEAFELAAILRDRLVALQQLRNSQSLFGATQNNRDYVGLKRIGNLCSVYILCEREGKITHNQHFLFTSPDQDDISSLMGQLIAYLYLNGIAPPQEILLPHALEDLSLFQQMLYKQYGRKIKLTLPRRGELYKRVQTATDNAAYQLKLESAKRERRVTGLNDLAHILGLPTPPKRIEAFDISNLGSTNIVGASVVFLDGKPAKQEYRKYKIHTSHGQDDFASMRELVFRRVSNPDRPLPDLLLIDGGKGQLQAAIDAVSLAKKSVVLVALAKKEELLYVPNQSTPITLAANAPALLLLTAIRDEVHRFVLSFHRQRRTKTFTP